MASDNPAYLVASSFMHDGHGSLEPYGTAAQPLLAKYGGEVVIAGSTGQFLHHFEGEWNQGARFTLFKFPSMDALRGFWNCPEYQQVKHLRTDVIPTNFTFAVEASEPPRWDHSS